MKSKKTEGKKRQLICCSVALSIFPAQMIIADGSRWTEAKERKRLQKKRKTDIFKGTAWKEKRKKILSIVSSLWTFFCLRRDKISVYDEFWIQTDMSVSVNTCCIRQSVHLVNHKTKPLLFTPDDYIILKRFELQNKIKKWLMRFLS